MVHGLKRRFESRDFGPGSGQAGMVTVEIAVAVIAVVVVAAMMMFCVGVGVAQVRTQEAARTAAREAARGESDAVVRQAAQRNSPGASVRINRRSDEIEVVVSRRIEPLGSISLPGVTVASRSVAAREPR